MGMGGTVNGRVAAIAHGRQRLIGDIDCCRRILGEVASVGDRDRDGLARIAHLAPRQRRWVRIAVIAGLGTGVGMGSVARRPGMSSAVSTAWTPGIARAAAVSIPPMRACGWGLRTKHA